MPKYQWESKPPLTRNDVFCDNNTWEQGDFHCENDEKAVDKIQKRFDKYKIYGNLTLRLIRDGKTLITFKT